MQLENITSGAPAEPLDLPTAKAHLIVHDDNDDALITSQITAARSIAERFTGRVIAPQSWRLTLDCFAKCIEIPKADLISITELAYTDADGNPQTLAANAYNIRYGLNYTCLVPAYGTDWPKTEPGYGKVTLEFIAGYGVGLIPADLLAAIKLILGELYLHREGSIEGTIIQETPITAQHLMRPYKIVSL